MAIGDAAGGRGHQTVTRRSETLTRQLVYKRRHSAEDKNGASPPGAAAVPEIVADQFPNAFPEPSDDAVVAEVAEVEAELAVEAEVEEPVDVAEDAPVDAESLAE